MIRWAVLAKEVNKVRFDCLSQFMTSSGIENELTYVSANSETFADELQRCQNEFDQIRIGPPFGEIACEHHEMITSTMMTLKSADSLVKQENHWWLRSSSFHGIQEFLNRRGESVDLSGALLVVGSGAAARIACAAFVKLGFRQVSIASAFDEQGRAMIEDFKRFYFDVTFNFVPKDELVLLPGIYSVIINTTPYIKSNELLPELYFFNFLMRPGLVCDLSMIPPVTPLLQEAEAIQIPTLGGYQFASCSDLVWVNWITGQKLSVDKYMAQLKPALDAASSEED